MLITSDVVASPERSLRFSETSIVLFGEMFTAGAAGEDSFLTEENLGMTTFDKSSDSPFIHFSIWSQASGVVRTNIWNRFSSEIFQIEVKILADYN